MRKCSSCKGLKYDHLFRKDLRLRSGRTSICKACTSKKMVEYQRTEKSKTTKKRWTQTDAGKRYKHRGYLQERSAHPDRIGVRKALNDAVVSGRIPRASTQLCAKCYGAADHYHHSSYEWADRFKVTSVCRPCHRAIHENHSLGGSNSHVIRQSAGEG